jgi:hypothetical protein
MPMGFSSGRFVALALMLPAAPASAQSMMSTSTLDLGIMQSQQNSFLFQSINQSNAGREASRQGTSNRPRGRRTDGAKEAPPAPGVTAGATATRFRSVAPSLVPRQLAAELGRDTKQRAVLEQYFEATLRDYRAIVHRVGAPTNDVARAASFVVATCYDTLHGEHSFDDKSMDALRAQLARALPTDPKFRTFDDRRKQEAYERFAILGMHLGGLRLRASETKDAALMQVANRMARRQLEDMFGVPADRIRIDRAGLRF